MKKVILLLVTALSCCGFLSAQEAHWTFNKVNDYKFNQPLVAFVQINGEYVTSADYEVGVFVNDDLRGAATMADHSDLGDSHPIVELPVYYNDNEDSEVTFKLYNKAAEEEVAECEASIDVLLGAAHVELYADEAQALVLNFTLTVPALAVTIDDDGKDTDNWQATPAEQQAGQTVTLSYSGKKKVKSITIEKAATAPAAAIAPALMDGATVVIEYNCDGFVTYFTFTNNGGTYSCNITGDSDGYSASLTKQGNTLVFVAHHSYIPDSNDSTINFDTTSDTYSFAKKAGEFWNFKISVNGTDITDKLSEVQ